MPLMAYEPDTEGCANCGRLMGEHPFKDLEPDTCVGPTECEAFIDPEFVAGVDREEDEPTRSEVHGVSTAGYGDDVKTPMIGSDEWLRWMMKSLPADAAKEALRELRVREIERVQPAFRGRGYDSYTRWLARGYRDQDWRALWR